MGNTRVPELDSVERSSSSPPIAISTALASSRPDTGTRRDSPLKQVSVPGACLLGGQHHPSPLQAVAQRCKPTASPPQCNRSIGTQLQASQTNAAHLNGGEGNTSLPKARQQNSQDGKRHPIAPISQSSHIHRMASTVLPANFNRNVGLHVTP